VLEQVRAAEDTRVGAEVALREAERACAEGSEARRRTEWLIEQRKAAPQQGPLAVRKAQLEGELAVERRQAERVAREQAELAARTERLRAQHVADVALIPLAKRLAQTLRSAGGSVEQRGVELEAELANDREAGEAMAGELRSCAAEEAEIQVRRSDGERDQQADQQADRSREDFGCREAPDHPFDGRCHAIEHLRDGRRGEVSEESAHDETDRPEVVVVRRRQIRVELAAEPADPTAEDHDAQSRGCVHEVDDASVKRG